MYPLHDCPRTPVRGWPSCVAAAHVARPRRAACPRRACAGNSQHTAQRALALSRSLSGPLLGLCLPRSWLRSRPPSRPLPPRPPPPRPVPVPGPSPVPGVPGLVRGLWLAVRLSPSLPHSTSWARRTDPPDRSKAHTGDDGWGGLAVGSGCGWGTPVPPRSKYRRFRSTSAARRGSGTDTWSEIEVRWPSDGCSIMPSPGRFRGEDLAEELGSVLPLTSLTPPKFSGDRHEPWDQGLHQRPADEWVGSGLAQRPTATGRETGGSAAGRASNGRVPARTSDIGWDASTHVGSPVSLTEK